MCSQCEVTRKSVKVKRKPITVARDNGWCRGGWFAFPMPDEEPPVLKARMQNNERVLWCPWCDDWSIYKRDGQSDKWSCTGICGWGNTDEFYVKTMNKLWFEGIPTKELQKMNIPAPSKGRR